MNRQRVKTTPAMVQVEEETDVRVLKDMIELQQELIASLVKEVYRLSDEVQQLTTQRRRAMPKQQQAFSNKRMTS